MVPHCSYKYVCIIPNLHPNIHNPCIQSSSSYVRCPGVNHVVWETHIQGDCAGLVDDLEAGKFHPHAWRTKNMESLIG